MQQLPSTIHLDQVATLHAIFLALEARREFKIVRNGPYMTITIGENSFGFCDKQGDWLLLTINNLIVGELPVCHDELDSLLDSYAQNATN